MADILVPPPARCSPPSQARSLIPVSSSRDNHADAGAVAISNLTNLQVASGSSPFGLTAPIQNEVFQRRKLHRAMDRRQHHRSPHLLFFVIRLSTDGDASRRPSPTPARHRHSPPLKHHRPRQSRSQRQHLRHLPSCSALLPANDGSLDFFDYDAFVVCFEGTAPAHQGASADFDNDGTVDFLRLRRLCHRLRIRLLIATVAPLGGSALPPPHS